MHERKEALSAPCKREDLGGQQAAHNAELGSWSRRNEVGDLGEQSSGDTE